MGRKKGLSPKRKLAIQKLFETGFNSKKALEEAGYAKSITPDKVFGQPEVKKEIEVRQNYLARKHNISQDRIVDELRKLAFHGVGDLIEVDEAGNATFNFNKLTDDHRAAVKAFTVKEYKEGKGKSARQVKETKVEFVNKLQAIDQLSTHLGLKDKGSDDSKSLIDALTQARRRVRIQIDDDPDSQ